MACKHTGATIRVAPIDQAGNLLLDQFAGLFSDRTKLVGITQVSNVLGTIYPVKQVVELAHARGVPVLVDGAQSAAHLPIDVQDLGCDFFAASGHKMYGPSGTGFLYGRAEWLERMEPSEGGSEMAQSVTFTDWQPKPLPQKFEAGTPAITETVALGTALDYMNGIGMERIKAYEQALVGYATQQLAAIDRVQVLGAGTDRVSIVSFVIDGLEPHQVGQFLDQEAGIATRFGQLSCQPLIKFLGIPGAVRASFSFYNTRDEIDRLAEAMALCVQQQG